MHIETKSIKVLKTHHIIENQAKSLKPVDIATKTTNLLKTIIWQTNQPASINNRCKTNKINQHRYNPFIVYQNPPNHGNPSL